VAAVTAAAATAAVRASTAAAGRRAPRRVDHISAKLGERGREEGGRTTRLDSGVARAHGRQGAGRKLGGLTGGGERAGAWALHPNGGVDAVKKRHGADGTPGANLNSSGRRWGVSGGGKKQHN